MDDDIRKEFELIRNVMDQNTSTLIKDIQTIKNDISTLNVGQEKMQLCIDGITNDVTVIKERTSKIEYQLTHFVN